MWWTLDWINYHETRTLGFKISKVSIGFLILVYFGTNLVICNDDIPVCSEQLKDLEADMEDWLKNCLNVDSKDQNIQCCEEQKKYNQERMSTHINMCFYKDLYPEPFLFLRSRTEIHAIDLLTQSKTVVIKGLQGRKMDYDSVTKKLYFQNGNNVSRANYDGSGVQMILQDLNATVYSMAIDWIGRRIFWTVNFPRSGIFVAKLDGKEKRMLVLNTSIVEPLAIAVDPNEGYLFWTERGGLVRQINLATYATLTLANESEPYAIAVDCTKKLVYWFVQKFGFNHVSLSDYHGKNNYTIESKLESFREHLVGVFGEMLPMQKKGKLYINLQNESKAINRDLEIDTAYYELILVDSNFQPIRGCPKTPCGQFGYCMNTTGNWSCHCEVGFNMTGNSCTDIDECSLGTPCGPKNSNNCTNYPGFYKCACGLGFYSDENERNCIDIDECLSSPCGSNTTCNNFPGFYNCTCGDGYIWYKNEKKCNISEYDKAAPKEEE